MTVRTALVTGVNGQDGAYLARLLVDKGYLVHGVRRRSSSSNTARLEAVGLDVEGGEGSFILHHGDVTDGGNMMRLMREIAPDEVYNLAAQSHVQRSFESPEHTAHVDALGALRLLEAIRLSDMIGRTRFYQASTSELYGKAHETPQSEATPFHPRSPYAVAKLYAYWITVNYREAYGLHGSNGILFNHESPLRGENFVTRKITIAAASMAKGDTRPLALGNLDAKRDWGHARDYVEGMWRMLQQEQPDDYVLATGETHSVREFVERAFAETDRRLEWRGSGLDEIGIDAATGQTLVVVDPAFFRPAEVDLLLGDPTKAMETLGWRRHTSFEQLVSEMVATDLTASTPRRES